MQIRRCKPVDGLENARRLPTWCEAVTWFTEFQPSMLVVTRPSIRLGNHRVPLPRTRLGRSALGAGLIVGGFLGFLPILGWWMIPAGLVVLSVDSGLVRRSRRRFELRLARWARARTGPAWLVGMLQRFGLRP
jgi:hypothetical protein